jgi:GT2 family glycosyltransferase
VNRAAKRKPGVLMAIPSGEEIKAATAMCLINAAFALDRAGYAVSWINQCGTMVGWNQDHLATLFLADTAYDHIWYIDSDMFFGRDVGVDLLRRGRDVVGCNYRTRKDPRVFTAKHLPGQGRDEGGNPPSPGSADNFSGTWDTGMREVDFVATGMLMISRRAVEAVAPPRFETQDDPACQVGNDASFCRKARLAGFPVFCDFVTSRKVAHIGSAVLRWDLGLIPLGANMETVPS